MSKRILAEIRDGKTALALMDENRLLDFSREKQAGLEAEQIYLGVVDRIVRGMEAAFVRLDKKQIGFLPFAECKEKPKSGDRLLLQIKKPPIGEKAAYLTTDISLAAHLVILTPNTARAAVSKKITDSDQRRRLYALAERLAPAGIGLVMRLESKDAPEEEIAAETSALLDKWQRILQKASAAQPPCMIEGRESLLLRFLRDEPGGIDEILSNAPEALPDVPCPVRLCENPFAIYAVQGRLDKSLRRKVWLDCGGFLVIDRTEALTVIDVNSGKFTGGKSGSESTFRKLNLEAAQEIARLLRLRRLGGIILVDFVDMQSQESRDAVTIALEEALQSDPVKTVVHGFTSLGLMELTRKKTDDQTPTPTPLCPYCHGTGLKEDESACL